MISWTHQPTHICICDCLRMCICIYTSVSVYQHLHLVVNSPPELGLSRPSRSNPTTVADRTETKCLWLILGSLAEPAARLDSWLSGYLAVACLPLLSTWLSCLAFWRHTVCQSSTPLELTPTLQPLTLLQVQVVFF